MQIIDIRWADCNFSLEGFALPDRLFTMMAPVAQLHARKMASAFEALCAQACLESAMTGALVARGMAPGTAQMTVDQWQALGLFVPANVYAPAHIAEATLTGQAVPTTQQVGTQPGLIGALGMTPGYEQLMAQPGVMGKQLGMMGKQSGIMGKPGIQPTMQPGMTGKPAMTPQAAPFWGSPMPGKMGAAPSLPTS